MRFAPWLTILVVAGSGYLLADGRPHLFYIVNVLAHLGLGLALLVVWIGVGREVVRNGAATRPLGALLLGLMAVSALSALGLLVFGNLSPMRPLLWTHIVASFGAALATLRWFRERGRLGATGFRLALGVLALAVVVPATRPLWPTPAQYVITNPALPPADMADEAMGGADGPFFPSASATADGQLIPDDFFLDAETCGRTGCHPDVTEQWDASAHHFSSFNNQWYRKSIEYMQEVVGVQSPQWCAGCHDHALLFSGQMAQPVADYVDTPAAQAGLTCVSCHSVASVQNTMGNGGFVMEYPALHQFVRSTNPALRGLHDFLVKIDPEPHRRAFLKPFHREQSAEFCSSCHKVHLDVPVNNYRWLRGFNTYDNWQASGVSHEGARSFYAPPAPLNCVSCHMPETASDDAGHRDGFVKSHRFVAANTALPTANQDAVQLRKTIEFLQNNQIKVDIFAVSEPSALPAAEARARRPGETPALASTFAVGEEAAQDLGGGGLTTEAVAVFAPLATGDTVLRPGTSVRLDVVVRTLGLGHFFPSGTVDAQEAWLEVKATDDTGRLLLWSGWTQQAGDGPADPSAHFYRNLMVDGHANRIDKRNAWAARAVVYVNLIPPGAADVAHYRLAIPEDVGPRVTITAKLHYRKFDWQHTQFAYAGERAPGTPADAVTPDYDDGVWQYTADLAKVSGTLKQIPVVPIVTMAEDEVTLRVAEVLPPAPRRDRDAVPTPLTPVALAAAEDTETRTRWNDYGIALMREGDLKGAEQAFREVTHRAPSYADGWVNLARVYLQEGDLDRAATVLAEAEAVQPGYHKTRYFRGLYHKALGAYPAALADLEAVAEAYPRDRVVLNQIGRVYFLDADPEAALPYFARVLAIDPEDLMAHYNLMLTHRALGHTELAEAHEARYRRFKDDEASQALARQYRQRHPYDNNEALPIHEHPDGGRPPRP